ncbi:MULTISPECIES: restriction endonuclease [Streptomyces]|uniref:Restriction endonuclease n=1 Tax=Streptomyces glycanivorans TaxID=3033808 RepID=A0ABY9J8Z8_9ACTN|nr:MULTISPECIES: restriction endonuclease [unclassified Streptomyces]WSQ77026.1 restriction endonuclease [Streptomyces sp. NBC_01213]WLQ63640.1 restriction endonuclease [Streptomyces sp. Alt3]WSQ84354.1 restriction endonuclease [Streptomyces sp. NBC_01212]WSR09588.1 restriction endonuclease [Streptomyces sp. NBC_01208]WSR47684.1 restriction endonuclease [Streptomyces sp. NBC_01201]
MPERRPVRSWQDAEHNAAAWMRYWGYTDARADPGGPDGGIDVRSARALGQVKYVAAAVGRPELQLLFGARGRLLDRQLLFFTGSSYAAPALRYALENDIALFVYGLDGSMEARNAPARRITDRARAAETARAAEARRLTAAGSHSAADTGPAPGQPTAASPGRGSRSPDGPHPNPPPAARKERRPGTERMLLGLFMAFVALILPAGDSYTPQPGRLVATVLLLVVPCWLLVWGAVTKSRRRFWPVGLSLFLLHLSLAWATNAQLWQGDTSDLLLPGAPLALCLLTSTLLIRWHARTGDEKR